MFIRKLRINILVIVVCGILISSIFVANAHWSVIDKKQSERKQNYEKRKP